MFNKKIIVSTLAVFATLMAFGVIVFGILMEDFYLANQSGLSLRAPGDELMGVLAFGELIMAYAFVWIGSHHIGGSGASEGMRFGFFMGLFWATVEILNYAFMPMQMNLMLVGFILDVVMFTLAGAVLSLVWNAMSDHQKD